MSNNMKISLENFARTFFQGRISLHQETDLDIGMIRPP